MSSKDFPEFIGPYRVLRPIGKGGMSEVLEVEDAFSGERFALKWLTRSGRARKRFDREYEAMIRLNHPSVVRVYHYGLQDQRPWMTMELVDGDPVQRFAKLLGRPGTEVRTRSLLNVAGQMAQALDHVHRRGLIHRDLKSANVLVLPDGRVKLIDFGTAKIEQPMEEITGAGEFVGTYAYASPEQLRGKSLSLRSDLYNLGVLFYRMFTGKLPFYGEGVYDIAKQHVEAIPVSPMERTPSLPKALSDLIMKMLEKNPDRRPRSARVVAEAFDQLIGHRAVAATTVEFNAPYHRMVGRDEQLTRTLGFVDALVPGSMLIAMGGRGCGRRAFYRALRESMRGSKISQYRAVFRRETTPMSVLAGLCLRVAQDLKDRSPSVAEAARRLESQQEWEPDALIEVSQHVFSQAGVTKVVFFLRSLHFANLDAWRVIWAWQEEWASRSRAWVIFGDALDWLGTRSTLPRRVAMKAQLMRLPPLDTVRLGCYIGSLLNRRPPPLWLTQQIGKATGGWPLHVEVLLRRWVNDGVLKVDGKDPNRLRWDQVDREQLQPVSGYTSAIEQGLDFLDSDELQVLGLVVLAERPVLVAEVLPVVGLNEVRLMECLRLLHRARWLRLEHTTVVCENGQVARQMLDRLTEEQFSLFQQHLLALDNLKPEVRIRGLLRDGQLGEAVQYAAQWAEQQYDNEAPITAMELVDQAFPDLPELATAGIDDWGRLWLVYVRCVLALRPSDSLARQLFNGLKEQEGTAKALQLDYAGAMLAGVIGHYPMFRELLERAWEKHHGGRPSTTLLLVGLKLAWVEEQFGDLEKASEWYNRLQEVVARLGRKSARTMVLQGQARQAYTAGRLDEAAQIAAKGMKTLEGISGVSARAEMLPVYIDCLRLEGRFSEAVMLLAEALAQARNTEMPRLVVPLLLAAARCEIDLYRLGRAQEYVDELMVSLRPGEHLYLRLEATLLRGRILVSSGEYHQALGVLNTTQEKALAAGLSVIAYVSSALAGRALCSLGHVDDGDRRMSEATKELASLGRLGAAMDCALIRAQARGGTLNPEHIFESVRDQLQAKTAVIPRLEWLIAMRRFNGSTPEVSRDIDQHIAQIMRMSSGTERSALRVHPWALQARLQELSRVIEPSRSSEIDTESDTDQLDGISETDQRDGDSG